MRSPVALLAPVLALILSACAPLPPSQDDPAALAAAEEARAREAARTEAQLAVKKQIDLVARHTRAICVAPENRAYFRHTPCLPVEVTDKHLADKKLPTAAELRIAKRVFSRIDDMNRDTLAVMLQTEDPYYKELAEKQLTISATTKDGKTLTTEDFEFVAGQYTEGINGYWLNAIAVPEPSTYAMIFGAVALGFARYRRRK